MMSRFPTALSAIAALCLMAVPFTARAATLSAEGLMFDSTDPGLALINFGDVELGHEAVSKFTVKTSASNDDLIKDYLINFDQSPVFMFASDPLDCTMTGNGGTCNYTVTFKPTLGLTSVLYTVMILSPGGCGQVCQGIVHPSFNLRVTGTGIDYLPDPLSNLSAVPLPAALPLFGSALAVAGFFGWRRRRKAAA